MLQNVTPQAQLMMKMLGPMASLLPNNYITVNVDSEVGYSYSYPADLAELNPLNEAELPHSLCTTPSIPPDSEPIDTYNMPILAPVSPCSTASSSVGDLRSSATLHQLADAVQPSPSPPPDSEPMDISDVQPMDTSDPSDDAELPMEASESPKKVAREPVSPCSKESRGGRVEPLDSEPATQNIVTNNYDMPILSGSPQLSPSLSPELEPMDTSDPAESLPHKSVSEEADSTTNNVISIPDTDTDMANSEIISKGQLLLDSMELSLPTPTHFITVSPLSKPSPEKKLVLGRMVEPPVSHPAPPCPEKKSRKVAMEQRRQSQSNLSLFADAWSEQNYQALRTSWKRAFGEDPGRSGGGGAAVPPPLERLLLQGVPHPPQRRQLRQLPHHHRQAELPLDSLHQMQDPRREGTQQLPALLYLYE